MQYFPLVGTQQCCACSLRCAPYVWWNVLAAMAWGYSCPRVKERWAATIMFNHPWHIIALIVPLNLRMCAHAHIHTRRGGRKREITEFWAAVLVHHLSAWCQVALVSSDYKSSCCLRWSMDQLAHLETPGQAIWSVGHKGAPRGGNSPSYWTAQTAVTSLRWRLSAKNVPLWAWWQWRTEKGIIQSFRQKLHQSGWKKRKVQKKTKQTNEKKKLIFSL